MDRDKKYILYVWEEPNSLFLYDANYQLDVLKGASCVYHRLIDNTNEPLYERPQFKKLLEKVSNEYYNVVVFDILVFGNRTLPILNFMDFLEKHNKHLVVINSGSRSNDAFDRLNIGTCLQNNECAHQSLMNSFIVLTGREGDGKIGMQSFKGTILLPRSILRFLNDDLWIHIFRVETKELVYTFNCSNSLKENERQIYHDVKKLFIIELDQFTPIFSINKVYALYIDAN